MSSILVRVILLRCSQIGKAVDSESIMFRFEPGHRNKDKSEACNQASLFSYFLDFLLKTQLLDIGVPVSPALNVWPNHPCIVFVVDWYHAAVLQHDTFSLAHVLHPLVLIIGGL